MKQRLIQGCSADKDLRIVISQKYTILLQFPVSFSILCTTYCFNKKLIDEYCQRSRLDKMVMCGCVRIRAKIDMDLVDCISTRYNGDTDCCASSRLQHPIEESKSCSLKTDFDLKKQLIRCVVFTEKSVLVPQYSPSSI